MKVLDGYKNVKGTGHIPAGIRCYIKAAYHFFCQHSHYGAALFPSAEAFGNNF